jgi:hypothetical protein
LNNVVVQAPSQAQEYQKPETWNLKP